MFWEKFEEVFRKEGEGHGTEGNSLDEVEEKIFYPLER